MTERAIFRLTRTTDVDALMRKAQRCARKRRVKDRSAANLLRLGLGAYLAQEQAAPPAVVAPAILPAAAERLKRARERAGLSMGALGRVCELEGHHRVSQIERGLQPLTGRVLEWVEEQERATGGAR